MEILIAISTVVSLAGLALGVVTARRERPIRHRFDIARVVLGVLAIVALGAITGVNTPGAAAAGAAIAGLIVGYVQGQSVAIRNDGARLLFRRSIPGAVLFSAGLIGMQVAGLGSRTGVFKLGQTLAIFSVATALGLLAGRRPAEKTAVRTGPTAVAYLFIVGLLLASSGLVDVAPALAQSNEGEWVRDDGRVAGSEFYVDNTGQVGPDGGTLAQTGASSQSTGFVRTQIGWDQPPLVVVPGTTYVLGAVVEPAGHDLRQGGAAPFVQILATLGDRPATSYEGQPDDDVQLGIQYSCAAQTDANDECSVTGSGFSRSDLMIAAGRQAGDTIVFAWRVQNEGSAMKYEWTYTWVPATANGGDTATDGGNSNGNDGTDSSTGDTDSNNIGDGGGSNDGGSNGGNKTSPPAERDEITSGEAGMAALAAILVALGMGGVDVLDTLVPIAPGGGGGRSSGASGATSGGGSSSQGAARPTSTPQPGGTSSTGTPPLTTKPPLGDRDVGGIYGTGSSSTNPTSTTGPATPQSPTAPIAPTARTARTAPTAPTAPSTPTPPGSTAGPGGASAPGGSTTAPLTNDEIGPLYGGSQPATPPTSPPGGTQPTGPGGTQPNTPPPNSATNPSSGTNPTGGTRPGSSTGPGGASAPGGGTTAPLSNDEIGPLYGGSQPTTPPPNPTSGTQPGSTTGPAATDPTSGTQPGSSTGPSGSTGPGGGTTAPLSNDELGPLYGGGSQPGTPPENVTPPPTPTPATQPTGGAQSPSGAQGSPGEATPTGGAATGPQLAPGQGPPWGTEIDMEADHNGVHTEFRSNEHGTQVQRIDADGNVLETRWEPAMAPGTSVLETNPDPVAASTSPPTGSDPAQAAPVAASNNLNAVADNAVADSNLPPDVNSSVRPPKGTDVSGGQDTTAPVAPVTPPTPGQVLADRWQSGIKLGPGENSVFQAVNDADGTTIYRGDFSTTVGPDGRINMHQLNFDNEVPLMFDDPDLDIKIAAAQQRQTGTLAAIDRTNQLRAAPQSVKEEFNTAYERAMAPIASHGMETQDQVTVEGLGAIDIQEWANGDKRLEDMVISPWAEDGGRLLTVENLLKDSIRRRLLAGGD